MFDLTDRTALITGATGGIGAAIARAMHAKGAVVAISGRRGDMLDALAGQLGGRVHVIACDIASKEEAEGLVPAAEKAMGHVDILVNNAGVTRDQLFVRMKDEDWDQVLAVDLTAAFRLARATVRGMMRRRFGRIIGIASVVGVTGNAGQANYAAAKAGMIAMTKSLAQEVASRGVTANVIAPGFIETAMTEVLPAELKENILKNIPLGRAGSDVDVAHAVKFLASEEAGYVTGHVLNVNGGILMG